MEIFNIFKIGWLWFLAEWPQILSTLLLIYIAIQFIIKKIINTKIESHYELKTQTAILNIEAQLKSANSKLENEINTLASNRNARFGELDKRTLDAIEKTWSYVSILNDNEPLIQVMRRLKTDAILSSNDPALSQAQAAIAQVHGVEEKLNSLREQFPNEIILYLSDKAFKLFMAYTNIHHSALIFISLTANPDPEIKKLLKEFEPNEDVISLIPDAKQNYEKFGPNWSFSCTLTLKSMLLNELRSMNGGTHFDEQTALRVAAMRNIATSLEGPNTQE